ncbi:Cupredoxin [Bimuria novae-zelandiae CBS 107.79]|uniref:Cupredoxin n=1 Tax=Bimuria novae-zelandiae CBS 107.79 TaxID=1447943 RepID=A0A6A5US06_9PLEO|nr:Cupredoxin [Bimuria novae-zelandiae CBS 107.79]
MGNFLVRPLSSSRGSGPKSRSSISCHLTPRYTHTRADIYGSYFYHAHARGQIDDGCYGPITIRPKYGIVNPFDMISRTDLKLLEAAEARAAPLVISDWRHTTSIQTWGLEQAAGTESALCVDSLLVNGKGAVDCWSREDLTKYTSPAVASVLQHANLSITDKGCVPPDGMAILLPTPGLNISAIPPSVFDVCTPTQGYREVIKAPSSKKWMALNIISSAAIGTFAVSFDEHPIWVFAVDGHYIEPLQVEALILSNGERYSIFIQLDKPCSNYAIRIASLSLPQLISTTAVLSYETAEPPNGSYPGTVTSKPYINQAGVNMTADVVFFNQAEMLRKLANSDSPLLYQDPHAINIGANLTIATKNNTWVDLIFQVKSLGQPPHPIHKHSNKGFIIGQGEGNFTWNSVAEAASEIPENFTLALPPYRDGFITPATAIGPTWLAVRYHVVNPGAFLLHCYI